LGDFIKVMSAVIAYQFIAKKMFVHFVITELFLIVITYFSSIYLVDAFGVEGANIGHFVSHLLYYIIVLLIFSSSLFGVLSEEHIS
jgi:PST family polysaccharide transporter